MSGDKDLKEQLPFPYNQDLSKVLTHLDRRTPFARERLANNPVTAAYIAAAVRLAGRHLGPNPDRAPADPRDENSLDRKLFSFISQRAVAEEVANNPDPFPRQGNVATMRATWKSHSDFIADLISFATWPGHLPAGFYDEMAAGAERLLEGPDAVDAVHQLAYMNVAADNTSAPAIRLTYVAMTAADGDKTLSEAIGHSYDVLMAPWKEVYAAFSEARGLKLRPGITVDDIANILAALVDGLELRTISNPSAALIDHDRKRTVLGTAALALAYSFFQPDSDQNGKTLEQAVHELIYRHQEPAPTR
ncbi:MAG TPA: hypothetical protein VGS19_20375 [Streptosporangiaceae bacterium]|nr:hypothetical protein [Streptosporangiaceae bacterium]